MREIDTYRREIRWLLHQISDIVEEIPPERRSWRPDTGTGNSAGTIASHVLGATRVYVLGFGCGRPVERDRSAEFSTIVADADAVVADLRALVGEIDERLGVLSEAALDRRVMPPQHLWGTGQVHEITAREAIVESIRHAAIHLGELRLTRDLAVRM